MRWAIREMAAQGLSADAALKNFAIDRTCTHTHMGMHIVHKYSHILACFSRSSYLSLLKPELAFCRRHVGLVTKSVTVLWINALVVK